MKRGFFILLMVFVAVVHRVPVTHANPLNLPAACDTAGIELDQPEHWTAVWNFADAQGCIIYTGTSPEPDKLPPITNYQLIDCTVQGNVSFSNGAAYFDGASYLSCPFNTAPDQPLATNNHANFWVYAQARLQPATNGNPLFIHPNLKVRAPTQGGLAYLKWSFQRADNTVSTGSSARFSVSNEDDLRVATCQFGLGACDYNQIGYGQEAIVNGVTTWGKRATAPVRFTNNVPTIYIGYDPATNTYLDGVLGTLMIDPPYGKDPQPDALPPSPQ